MFNTSVEPLPLVLLKTNKLLNYIINLDK